MAFARTISVSHVHWTNYSLKIVFPLVVTEFFGSHCIGKSQEKEIK